jgi:thiamine kinase-like enzyme
MAVLATLHRQVWEHPELKVDRAIGAMDMNLPVTMALNAARNNFPHFVAALGDRLTPDLSQRYEKIFAILPHPLWKARRDNLKNVTVVHGDVQSNNFALPHESGQPLYLVDWALWHIDLLTYDLAYLLALHTPSVQRTQIEMNCLKAYHAHLNISQYSFQQLLDDYRLSVLFHTIWPVFFQSFTPMENWWPLLENSRQAFEEWQCEALL